MPQQKAAETEYDITKVDGYDTLRERMENAETIEDWSFILSDYISFGNNKIANNVGIFNLNAATDCPNIGTDNCQVPKESCYAYKAENRYPNTLPYRRRQEYLWDCLDADTFAKAFVTLVSRKRNPVDTIRFSEAGDFRHRGDIIKVNRISEILSPDFDVYTYSASDYLDWSESEHFTVNQSNFRSNYGDKAYTAIPKDMSPEEHDGLSDNAVQCAYEKSDGDIKCGECELCISPDAPDVYINLH